MHHFWPFLAVAFALVVLVQVAALLLRERRSSSVPAEPAAAVPDAGLRDEVRDLRDRVRVLERIVTDDGRSHRLSSRIDRLRDE